jgi:hypothetical protein
VESTLKVKASSAILGIALIAVSGAALHFWRELEASKRQIAISTSEVQERQHLTGVSPTPTPEQTSAVAGQPSQATTESRPSEHPDNSALVAESREAVLTQLASPEGKASRASNMRHRQASANPDVDEALGLTTTEAEKLFDLLAMQRMRSMETVSVQPENAHDREERLRKQREAEDAELQTLLGSKFPKWKDYQENRYAWEQRSDLRTVLDAAGIPLTRTQEGAIINALSTEQRRINQARDSTARGNSDNLNEYTPENRQRLLDAVAQYLSAQQLDGYKGLLERNASREQRALKLIESSGIH